MPVYRNPDCQRFADDMEAAGYHVEFYRGRDFWSGPAVRIERDDLTDVLRVASSISLQWDGMGKGLIVYPVESEPSEELR